MDFNEIQTWFDESLAPEGEFTSSYTFMVEQVAKAVAKIQKTVGEFGTPLGITVRQSINEESDYLRPVSSWPESVHRYFEDPRTQQPFHINNLEDFVRGGVLSSFNDVDINEDESLIIEDYNCVDASNSSQESGFQQRIKRLISEIDDDNLRNLMRDPNAYCLLVADIKRSRKSKPGHYRVRSILALYYTRTVAPSAGQYAEIKKKCKALFGGIRSIRNHDSALFRSRSAQLINNLMGLFTSTTITKADKIAFALQQMRHLTESHLIGRDISDHGKRIAARDAEGAVSVHFIQSRFERCDNEGDDELRIVVPKLELYPLAMALENPLGALLVADPDLPLLSKLLLRKYMKSEKTKLFISRHDAGRAFRTSRQNPPPFVARLDEKFGASADRIRDRPLPGRAPDTLSISSLTRPKIWQHGYRNVETSRMPRQSLVAFVVEGEVLDEYKGARLLPHGILAFEGWFPDSFSEADIETLHILAVGFSSLVRLTSHSMSSLSYDREIWHTYADDISKLNQPDGVEHAEMLFHFLRLDAALLHEIDKIDTQIIADLGKVEQRSILIAKEFINLFSEALPSVRDEELNDFKIASNLLRHRRAYYLQNAGKIVDFKIKVDEQYGSDNAFMSFLRSCPSNFVWAPYLGTVGEVLADRISNKSLNMARINVGFSADAVILAAVSGEFSQIVKLAPREKLKAERDAYQRFVRYRIPFAARQPQRGLALDSSGARGAIEGKTPLRGPYTFSMSEEGRMLSQRSFGALVSDVVDGARTSTSRAGSGSGAGDKERIETLESKIAGKLARPELHEAQSPPKDQANVLNALDEHFRVGVKLWRLFEQERREWLSQTWQSPAGVVEKIGEHTVARLIERRLRLEDLGRKGEAGGALRLGRHIQEAIVKLRDLKLEELFDSISSTAPPNGRQVDLSQWLTSRASSIGAADLQKRLWEALPARLAEAQIIHGDLNGRNLAWAQPFSRFFMIDFERTGYGIAGIDHWKLISSLLVDVFWAARAVHEEGDHETVNVVERIGADLERVLKVYDAFTDLLEGPASVKRREDVAKAIKVFKTSERGVGADFLANTITSIVLTLFGGDGEVDYSQEQFPLELLSETINGYDKKADKDRVKIAFNLNLYTSCCAAVRELNYSIEDLEGIIGAIDSDLVDAMIQAEDKSIGALARAGDAYLLTVSGNHSETIENQYRILIRAIIAFKVLLAALPFASRGAH